MAVAPATEFRIRWVDEHAPSITTIRRMQNGRNLLGHLIFDSGVEVCREDQQLARRPVLPIANFELCPQHDRRAVLHPARVLGRRAGTGVYLDAHYLVAVDEVVDVTGHGRLPRHVIYIVLHAPRSALEAGGAARARYHFSLRGVVDAKARHRAQDVGQRVRTQRLDLIRSDIETRSGSLPLGKPNLVETCAAARGHYHGID